jgi:hypothetical protein
MKQSPICTIQRLGELQSWSEHCGGVNILFFLRTGNHIPRSFSTWAALYCLEVEVEVEVNLRPTVSRPVCLGVRRPSGTFVQFFFLLEITFRHLRVVIL